MLFENDLAVSETEVGLGSVDSHVFDDSVDFCIVVPQFSLWIGIRRFETRNVAVLFRWDEGRRGFNVTKRRRVHIPVGIIVGVCSHHLLQILFAWELVPVLLLERFSELSDIRIFQRARHESSKTFTLTSSPPFPVNPKKKRGRDKSVIK